MRVSERIEPEVVVMDSVSRRRGGTDVAVPPGSVEPLQEASASSFQDAGGVRRDPVENPMGEAVRERGVWIVADQG